MFWVLVERRAKKLEYRMGDVGCRDEPKSWRLSDGGGRLEIDGCYTEYT